MRFEPVFLPEDRGLNGKASQTFLRLYNNCPRSAYLYQTYKGGAQTAAMVRGSALHAVCERATNLAVKMGEVTIPPEVVKAICEEVLAEFPVPIEEHDYLREMSYRWASEARFDPAAVVAVESLFVLELGGFQVRCKIDFAQLSEGGRAIYIPDYKSSKSAPAYEEIARNLDGVLVPKQFQMLLYAMAVTYGRRVIEDEDDVYDSFPVAPRAQRFDLSYVYPGIEDREGKMLQRQMTLTRLQLDEYRASFEALLTRVKHSEETGDWPAVDSDAACRECPAKMLCPIPAELKDFRGVISTVEQAAEMAEVLDIRQKQDKALRAEIKAFCAEQEIDLRYGNKVWEFVPVSRTTTDYEGMRATRFENPDAFTKTTTGTNFKSRDLTADELAEGSK